MVVSISITAWLIPSMKSNASEPEGRTMGILISILGLMLHYFNEHQAENVSFMANSLILVGVIVSILELILKETK